VPRYSCYHLVEIFLDESPGAIRYSFYHLVQMKKKKKKEAEETK
jgi:hypothetical protein